MQRAFKPHPPHPTPPPPRACQSQRHPPRAWARRSLCDRPQAKTGVKMKRPPVRLAPGNSLPVLGPVESSHGAEAAPPTPPPPGPREAHGLPQRRRSRRRRRQRPRPWEQARDAARNGPRQRRRTDAKTHALYGPPASPRLRDHVRHHARAPAPGRSRSQRPEGRGESVVDFATQLPRAPWRVGRAVKRGGRAAAHAQLRATALFFSPRAGTRDRVRWRWLGGGSTVKGPRPRASWRACTFYSSSQAPSDT